MWISPTLGDPAPLWEMLLCLMALAATGSVFGLTSERRAVRILSMSIIGLFLLLLLNIALLNDQAMEAATLLFVPAAFGYWSANRWIRMICGIYAALYMALLAILSMLGKVPTVDLFRPSLVVIIVLIGAEVRKAIEKW